MMMMMMMMMMMAELVGITTNVNVSNRLIFVHLGGYGGS
jgi:hypothetical protein